MSDADHLLTQLNSGRHAPSVGIDRAQLLPGPGIRIQVGVRVFPKKATIFDALAETINLAAEHNLAVVEVERTTREHFVVTVEPRSP